MNDADPLVVLDGISHRYGRHGVPALDRVDLRIERGTVVGLVGPNGSGKTTLFRLLLGFLRPQAGRVSVAGHAPARYRRRHGIGYLPEQVRLPERLTVRQLGAHTARLAGLSGEAVESAVRRGAKALALAERLDERVGTLSHGYRQRAGLLLALMGAPNLILLDEPANGLDPASLGVLRSLIRALRRRGRTILLSSHNLLEHERLCDEVVVLSGGRLLGRATRADLARHPDIWVVLQARPGDEPMSELRARWGGIRLASDEVAFDRESAARRYAAALTRAGRRVEAVERRPYGLEYLFGVLVNDADPRRVE